MVGDVDEALAFYGSIFQVRLRSRSDGAAFIDMGDQLLALMRGPLRMPCGHRHFGLVVDDRSRVRIPMISPGAQKERQSASEYVRRRLRAALQADGIELPPFEPETGAPARRAA